MTEYRITSDYRLNEVMSLKYYQTMLEKPLISSVAIRNDKIIGAVSIHPREDLIAMAPISSPSTIVAIKMIDLLEQTLIQYGIVQYFVPVNDGSPITNLTERLHEIYPDKFHKLCKVDYTTWYRRDFK